MHDVFISYKSDDSSLAMKVVNALEASGIRCWIAERNIRAGSNYAMDIPAAIRDASFFVLILTEKSQASPWVLKEVDAAITQQKIILPLMVGSFQLSEAMNFLLTGVQYFDATRNLNKTVKQIIEQIQEHTPAVAEDTAPIPEPVPEFKPVEPKPISQTSAGHTAAIPVIKCPRCGSTQAEQSHGTSPGKIGCLISLLLSVVFAFLGFWTGGLLMYAIGATSTTVGGTAILGTLVGAVGGFLVPILRSRKKYRNEWRCTRCGTVFIPGEEKK